MHCKQEGSCDFMHSWACVSFAACARSALTACANNLNGRWLNRASHHEPVNSPDTGMACLRVDVFVCMIMCFCAGVCVDMKPNCDSSALDDSSFPSHSFSLANRQIRTDTVNSFDSKKRRHSSRAQTESFLKRNTLIFSLLLICMELASIHHNRIHLCAF